MEYGLYKIKDEPVKGNQSPDDATDLEADSATLSFIPESPESSPIKKYGLSRDEVLKYQRNPFWVRLRWVIVLLVLLILMCMLIFVVMVIVFHPSCPHRPKLDFHQTEILYQIEVATFKDSDGDGVGDLNGIISKLNYLKENLGVGVVCLNRFTSKSNPQQIDEVYGSLDDLKKLSKQLVLKDMHLVLDLPASYLENNTEEIIVHWLTNYADGIRITEGKKSIVDSDKSSWQEIVSKVSANTFKKKYFDIVPNSDLGLNLQTLTNPSIFDYRIQSLYSTDDNSSWPNLPLGGLNSDRLATYLDGNSYKIAHSLILLLKGTPIILAGDEIALQGRDEIENYMKWDNSFGCGFTDNQEVGSYFQNVTSCTNSVSDATSNSSGTKTLVQLYKELSCLRNEPSLSWGDVKFNQTDHQIVSFVREATGFEGFLVAANTGKEAQTVDFDIKHKIPSVAKLVFFHSPEDLVLSGEFAVGQEMNVANVLLRPGQLLVAKFLRVD